MHVIRDIRHIRARRGAILAIGVFDGMHWAHRLIINACVRRARRIGGSAVVITFWPHPRGQKVLYSLEHRLRLLSHLGVDACIVVPFTGAFSRLSPRAFVEDIICRRVNARAVYVGENFRFGRNASGDAALLSQLLKARHVAVRIFKTIKVNGSPVSSSHIRRLISAGDLAAARRLLCAPVGVYGHVVASTGRGRELGFPTANIDLHHEVAPPAGVYAVRVFYDGTRGTGVCYIGTRPTFDPRRIEPVVEVHIFGFHGDLYGKYLEAQFIAKVRGQRAFPSISRLISQIERDIRKAKNLLR